MYESAIKYNNDLNTKDMSQSRALNNSEHWTDWVELDHTATYKLNLSHLQKKGGAYLRMGMIAPGLTLLNSDENKSIHQDKAVQPHATMKEVVDL